MLSRSVPKTPEKVHHEPKFTATDFLRTDSGEWHNLPQRAIIVYSKHLYQIISEKLGLLPIEYPYDGFFDQCKDERDRLSLIRLYPGAPLTAATVEEMAALGARKFLILGTAGSISGKAHFNDIVFCTRALRDEGTSYHYLRPSVFAYPSGDLTANLHKKSLESGIKALRGPSWTTDAPYMETVHEINEYRRRGILTVEMEASALFAVTRSKGLEAAAIFSVSDELNEENWTGMKRPLEGFEKLSTIAELFQDL